MVAPRVTFMWSPESNPVYFSSAGVRLDYAGPGIYHGGCPGSEGARTYSIRTSCAENSRWCTAWYVASYKGEGGNRPGDQEERGSLGSGADSHSQESERGRERSS